jgi:hypothetical protein
VEISAEFEKRAHDVTFGGFTRVMKGRFSTFLEILCSYTTRCQANVHLSHISRHRERTNLVSYVGILADLYKQLHDRQETLRGRFMKWGLSILVTSPPPSAQQHPSDPRYIHWQVPSSANKPLLLHWDQRHFRGAAPRSANVLQMTLYEVRSFHSGDITAPSTQQHPSDPRHIHRQKSATRL